MATTGDDEAKLRRLAMRARRNEQAILWFMVALGAMALAYIGFYLTRQSSHWIRRTSRGATPPSFLAVVPRKIRKVLIQRAIGTPSLGHATIIIMFIALNLICLFAKLGTSGNVTTNIASRAGWLAIANLVVVIFFALKNTPLAFLTAWSYERLQCLHRISGYAAVANLIVHATCYITYFCSNQTCGKLLKPSDIYGMVAGGCWLLLALAAVSIRRWWYELFYYLHVGLWVVSIVCIGLHQPRMTTKIVYGTMIAGSMWGLDRIIRFVRLMMNSANTATLAPLPNGGTRVTLAKSPLGAHSGKHCFLWIPRLRLFESHPFTIASTDPLEFVVASHSGFTAKLREYAAENPGITLKASVEGPYGTVPDPSAFQTVVLVAGGSGASFTFGLANALLSRAKGGITKRVIFVWTIKYHSYMQWFADHLAKLRDDPRFAIQVFVTRSEPPLPQLPGGFSEYSPGHAERYIAKHAFMDRERIHHIRPMGSLATIDLEKAQPQSDDESVPPESSSCPVDLRGIPIRYQKPNVVALVRDVVGGTRAEERVLIAGCGPSRMMDSIRETAAECIRSDGPSVELHCEEFGW
ncbi:Flavoprotein transmembrane component [Metarhizium album ARSEF 1941]|uniref:Flavoprotein transmembrane component n=1 Tax=Metarhizium album (strain ARSEF 1941) TaxID=1081103 RepID=A0A0B2WJC0_METAS|nr:Flavoprotein transmembrane component [Metarhizium album ARSEF 1941]KHN94013.1 Flavoprotein transmembrane component [Metarhizium album ARSEF 1941]